MNNLVGGLITEVGALNFPPGGATATENCIWTQKKTVKRRLGFNFEADFTPQPVSPLPVPPDVRFWLDIGMTQDGSKVIITDGDDIYLSLDSGVTFHNAVSGGPPHGGILGVDVSPDGSIIGAAIGSAGDRSIWASVDFGVNWNNISITGPGANDWQDLSFGMLGSPVLLATEVTTLHTWFYNFSGGLWTDRGDVILDGFSAGIIGNRLFFAANSGGVFGATFTDIGIFSNDMGANWTGNESPDHLAFWGAISADGSRIVYNGGGSGANWIYATDNGGIGWTLNPSLEFTPLAVCCDSNTGLILYSGDCPNFTDPGYIWKSSTQGVDWTRLDSPFIAGIIPDCSADGSKVVAISAAAGVWYSHDAGITWTQSAVLP